MRDLAIFISIVFVYTITGAQSKDEQEMQKTQELKTCIHKSVAFSEFKSHSKV